MVVALVHAGVDDGRRRRRRRSETGGVLTAQICAVSPLMSWLIRRLES